MGKSSSILSVNPYNQELLATYDRFTDHQIVACLDAGQSAYESWRKTTLDHRAELMNQAANLLRTKTDTYARTISLEMGKPIQQSRAEVLKCAWVCDYYAKEAATFLAPKHIATEAAESYVRYDAMGLILAVMPWNYPFWQLFRFAAPNLMAGNVGLLKHASNVPQSALLIEELFLEAGFPKGVFQTVLASAGQVADMIKHPNVKAVTLTGSEKAGVAIASTAGQQIKKTVLELGGSNAFVVFDDADIDLAVEVGVQARFQNTGQSCIAAKRFILMEGIYEKFLKRFVEKVKLLKAGDPLEDATEIGPMAREDLAVELEVQLQSSIAQGATLRCGGKRDRAYLEPTVLCDVKAGMPAFDEELFGPVAAIIKAKTEEEAIALANQSNFGLGVSLFSKDVERIKPYIAMLEDGAVFINELVKSDPRLPFGGTKLSGYGRELSEDGLLEFVNKKTVYIR